MKYALILFEPLVTPLANAESGTMMIPRFRGLFERVDALRTYVRNDYGQSLFVLVDDVTGEREEWNGRVDGAYELVPLTATLPAGVDAVGVGRFQEVYRIVMVSPKGRRLLTPYWVEGIEDGVV